MGKYDAIFNHLGKENSESPDIVEQALNNIDEEELNETLDDDNLANIDQLLNMPEFRSNASENSTDSTQDPSDALPEISDVEDDTPPTDLGSPDFDAETPEDTDVSEESPKSLAEQYPDIDSDVLKEFEHLSSPAPDINALLQQFEEKNQDIVNDLMEQNAETENDFEFQNEFEVADSPDASFQDTLPETLSQEDHLNDIDSNEDTGEIEDLLSQFSPEEESSETADSNLSGGLDSLLDNIGGEESGSPDANLEESPAKPSETISETSEDLTADDSSYLSSLLEEAKQEFPEDLTQEKNEDLSIPIESSDTLNIQTESSEDLGIDLEAPLEDMDSLPELDTSELGEFNAEEQTEIEPSNDMENLDLSDEEQFTEVSDDEDTLSEFDSSNENSNADNQASPISLSNITLDEQKILNIRNRINKIQDPDLRKKVRKILIDGRISVDLIENLITKLLLNESAETLDDFIAEACPELESELSNAEIPEQEFIPPQARPKQVLYAEDARKAQEFKAEFKKIGKYALGLFAALILLGLIFYRIIWMPSNANRFYKKGYLALQSARYTEAEANFAIALKKASPDLKWFNRYAQAYEKVNKIKWAEKKYMDALKIDPFNEQIIRNAANLFINHYPYQYDKAINLYTRLKKKHPKSFEITDLIGTTYIKWADHSKDPSIKTKYYNEANNVYNKYLIKRPKHLSSYFRQLQIALKMGDATNIKTYDDIILDINKKAVNLEIMTMLAKYYVNHREMTRAKKVFDRLINYSQKIVNNQMKNRLPLSDLNTTYPMLSESYYQYARFLTINIDYIKALDILGLATRINPRHGRAYNLLGEIYSVQEDMPRHLQLAKENFEKSIKYTPNYYKPYANLGHIYYYDKLNIRNQNNPIQAETSIPNTEQNLSRALFYYESATARLPKDKKDFLLQYNLSWLYYHYQNYLYAFKNWSNLYVDEPYNPVLSYALANTYFHMDKLSLARIEYDKSIEYYSAISKKMGYINPQLDRHREIYTQLARSYNNRGVINTVLASKIPSSRSKYQQQALLDFYQAKDEAHQIKFVYDKAEVNIKTLLNQSIRGRKASFDNAIPERTSLQDWIDEFKQKMILNL